jgi:hypothetical protein
MNDLAYDISHLLDAESAQPAPASRAPAKSAPATAPATGTVDAQEALARELLQLAEAHDELIRQYLDSSGATFQANPGGSPLPLPKKN